MDSQYSLDNLRDITLPDPPPLWPPAPGVWVLLGIVLLAMGIFVYQRHRAKKRNAYRQAGLALLDGATTVHDVSVILKRVALVAFPREQVASLYGEDWANFLRRTCARHKFSRITQARPDERASRKVIRLAAAWIKHHRVPGGKPQTEGG